MANLGRLFHTVCYLRPRQIYYQVVYRLTGRLQSSHAQASSQQPVAEKQANPQAGRPNTKQPLVKAILPPAMHKKVAPIAPITYLGRAHFSFLNLPHDFGTIPNIDWNHAAYGKLWTYNLNYCEWLRQPQLDTEAGLMLINDWIEKAATHRDGWEPYPISLRLVHWLVFFRNRGQRLTPRVQASIKQQYQQLWRKVEYHLGGNHLLENAIALFLTALHLFDDQGLEKASRLLAAELKEQYLKDGAHFELSPMYHCILLWRLLDVYSWLHTVPNQLLPKPAACIYEVLQAQLPTQLGWLSNMVDRSGYYPHFNDSTLGIAPEPTALFRYADRMGLVADKLPLADSGYRHWTIGELDVWMDIAAIGPDYIPGHAHADNLTFCLSFAGQPIIVDPSISTYEKNQRRHWERSTRAHNTVEVGNQNSSEVWGGFRVGRRARTRIIEEDEQTIVAQHNGYPGTTHRRTFKRINNGLLIEDALIGKTTSGTLRLHFDHQLSPTLVGHQLRVGEVSLEFSATLPVRLVPYEQCVGFNQLRKATCLVVKFTKKHQLILTQTKRTGANVLSKER